METVEKRKSKERPEFLNQKEWKDYYAGEIAEELGYRGLIKTEESPEKITGPETEPVISSRENSYTILSSYVRINTENMETEKEFVKACEEGVLKGLQYDQLRGIRIKNRETISALETLLDGQVSWMKDLGKNTEKVYREIRKDGFDRKALQKVEKGYLPVESVIELYRGEEKIRASYRTVVEKENHGQIGEKTVEQFRSDTSHAYLEDYQARIEENFLIDIEDRFYDRELVSRKLKTTEKVLRKRYHKKSKGYNIT